MRLEYYQLFYSQPGLMEILVLNVKKNSFLVLEILYISELNINGYKMKGTKMIPENDQTSEQTIVMNRQYMEVLQTLLTYKRADKIYQIQELIQSLMLNLQHQTLNCPECHKGLDTHKMLTEISNMLSKFDAPGMAINPEGIHLSQSTKK